MSNFGYSNKFDDLNAQVDKRPKYSIKEMAEVLKVDHDGLRSLIKRSKDKPSPIYFTTKRRGVKTSLYDKNEFLKWFESTGAKIKSANKESAK